MRFALMILTGVVACGCAVRGMAQESAAESSGQMVTVDIVIAEVARAAVDLTSGNAAATSLRELEERGEVVVLTRATVASLDRHPCRVQVGEQVALPTGRTAFGRQRGDGGAAPFQTSYSQQSTGTLLTVTPGVQADGSVVVEFQAEKSRLAPAPAVQDTNASDANTSDANASDIRPPRVITLTAQTTVHIPPGETVIAASTEAANPGESGQMVILVSARVSDARRAGGAAAAPTQLKIFALQNAAAKDAASVLTDILPGRGFTLAVDERTNSVVMSGRSEFLEIAEALLLRLDEAKTVQ